MTDRPKTTLRDCIYGLAVGDALGVPYEFRPRGTFKCADMIGYGTHGQPTGTWSDDTDTTAAAAGALAGTAYGIDAIPREWIDTLRGKDLIESCLF